MTFKEWDDLLAEQELDLEDVADAMYISMDEILSWEKEDKVPQKAIDWIKAEFQIELGDEQKENTFWCSALVTYVYINLGFLDKTLPWTIIAPRRFSYYENERLTYLDGCNVEPEVYVKFN